MKNIPKKIYLQIGDYSKDELKDLDFKDISRSGQISWCEDRINQTDLVFILKG
tara:strand:+ start:955 stop:1113 length:159 start_codon:yes stop_codon:yes gene_type:complete